MALFGHKIKGLIDSQITEYFSVLPSLSRASASPQAFPRKMPEYETLTTVAQTGPIYNAVAQQQGIGDLYQQTPSSYAVSTIISRQQPTTATAAASYTKI